MGRCRVSALTRILSAMSTKKREITLFRAIATGTDGAVAEKTERIAISTPGLRVISLDASNWGLKVRFDALINSNLPNPYMLPDSNEEPDVVVFDTFGHKVDGSIVFEADERGFSFIASGNGLVAGTYTLQLSGDSFGWRNELDTLEGDSTGVYRREFTIAASDTRIRLETGLVLPGQRLGLEGQGLAITLDQPGGVNSLTLQVGWNRNTVSIEGVVSSMSGAHISALPTPRVGESPTMQTRYYRASFDNPSTAGSLDLGRLVGTAMSQFVYGSLDSDLTVSVIEINGVAQDFATTRSLLVGALPGDATGDGMLNGADEQLFSNLATTPQRGFSAWRQLDPSILLVRSSGNGEPDSGAGDSNGSVDGSNGGTSGSSGGNGGGSSPIAGQSGSGADVFPGGLGGGTVFSPSSTTPDTSAFTLIKTALRGGNDTQRESSLTSIAYSTGGARCSHLRVADSGSLP